MATHWPKRRVQGNWILANMYAEEKAQTLGFAQA